mmetsp:Transcript_15611/g.27709  ORF Transcript_15611/g.27709 Transcript_15611/m.27709 type:complete len:219 (+) Transcript_15611:1002-1658(+)
MEHLSVVVRRNLDPHLVALVLQGRVLFDQLVVLTTAEGSLCTSGHHSPLLLFVREQQLPPLGVCLLPTDHQPVAWTVLMVNTSTALCEDSPTWQLCPAVLISLWCPGSALGQVIELSVLINMFCPVDVSMALVNHVFPQSVDVREELGVLIAVQAQTSTHLPLQVCQQPILVNQNIFHRNLEGMLLSHVHHRPFRIQRHVITEQAGTGLDPIASLLGL